MNAARPYVDRPIVDARAAGAVATRFASDRGWAEPQLLRVGMNAIFGSDDVVIRVGHATAPGRSAHDLAGLLISAGVPVAVPVAGGADDVGGYAVTAWERVRPTNEPIDWAAVGAAVARIHAIGPDRIPEDYPLPSPDRFPWWDFDALLAEVEDRIDASALAGLRDAIDEGRWWRDAIARGAVVCHGDVHPGNVIASDRGPVLIDFDLLCVAPPAWDHAMLTTYGDRWGGDPAAYVDFAAGYGRSLADDELTATIATLRNVASTLMRVRAGVIDERARVEAERRLRYWRGDLDAPVWQAQ